VYYEEYNQVGRAIAREKQLKGWRREKKERLIARMNPHWKDLCGGVAPGGNKRCFDCAALSVSLLPAPSRSGFAQHDSCNELL
jgi:hypothetical protein